MKTFSGKPILQDEKELQSLLDFVKEKEIETYLEIGVARGDTFHAIVSTMPVGSLGVAIDYPEKMWGISESSKDLKKASEDLISKGYQSHIIIGDSTSEDTISSLKNINKDFDMIFIDGNHTYDGVIRDFINYSPMAKYVVFHDITNDMRTNRKNETINVPTFWELLKFTGHYEMLEFCTDGSNYGIGVLWKSTT